MKCVLRIDKYLANSGVGSRAEVKKRIKKGLVKVNDSLIKDEAYKVDPSKDKVYLNGEEILYEPYIYIAMNKPEGVISATEDKNMDTVLDLLPKEYTSYGLFPVGRLDKDTTGLLILTNDGELSHFLTSPTKKIPKLYYVETSKPISTLVKDTFLKGIYFEKEGIMTSPASLEILDTHKCKLTIYEGKYHQVKRMFHAVENEVVKLHRLAVADFFLPDDLEEGGIIKLDKEALIKLGYKTEKKAFHN